MTRRLLLLGRLFMVSWAGVFALTMASAIHAGTPPRAVAGIAVGLGGTAVVWTWFWMRVVGTDDGRRTMAVVSVMVPMALVTLAVPPQCASAFSYPIVMAGAAYRPRAGLLAVAALAVVGATVDGVRGVPPWSLLFIAAGLVSGAAAVGAQLLLVAHREAEAAAIRSAAAAAGEERLRVARDLHDWLGQSLTTVALQGEMLALDAGPATALGRRSERCARRSPSSASRACMRS